LHFVPQNGEPSMTWSFHGSSIELIEENENAHDSIRINREFEWNEIDESDSQAEKHDDPRISISDQSMINKIKNKSVSHSKSFMINFNWKVMAVSYKMRNMMSPDFQHFVEF
jgi:hypothetical protein